LKLKASTRFSPESRDGLSCVSYTLANRRFIALK
jgi:hypothetical protein